MIISSIAKRILTNIATIGATLGIMSVLPKIYTNCNKKGLEQCEITDKYKEGYDTLYENPWANNHDATDVEEQMGIYQGFKYIPLICDLKKSFHMIQQNWYNDGNRYLKWIDNNSKFIFLWFDLLFVIIF